MNVLAVRQDNNGDVLLMSPALRALAARASRRTLVCGPSGYAAASALPGIDEVLVFEAAWIEANPRPVERDAMDAFVRRVAELRVDEAVIFTSFHQSPLPIALLLRMAGVLRIAAISEDYPGALLDVRHRGVPDDLHEVERALSLASAAGYELPPHDEGRLAMRVADANPVAHVRPYVVVHPGATVPARAWDPRANRDLVAALRARGETVVVTGGASERDLCAYVAGETAITTSANGGRTLNLAGETNFTTLARVIAGADALVVGNTGAAHVAAAVGTPVVSLFPPTIPAVRFRPWMVPHVLLGDQEIACRGCRARVCPLEDQPCLGVVTVDDVLRALASVRKPREAAVV
ncbi:MAG TPA: glycosyltransferase family 9 protein [Candidatus Elarobacter sp.]|jgi:ADP-heptose:LPS heptosyltransferase|nr:glycosyltransferase family 9 protein [Candidatus Elarobacter sp.]